MEKTAIKTGDKKAAAKTTIYKAAIVAYLTENVSAKSADIAELLGLKASRVKTLLSELIAEEIVVAVGGNRNRVYKLKS